MIIAIPISENKNEVCVSFGRAPEFLFYDTEKNEKKYLENLAANASGGAGISAAQFLVDSNVDVLLTPRCGENAAQVLNAAEIKIYKTTSLNIEDELQKFSDNKLEILSEVHAGFHNHGFEK